MSQIIYVEEISDPMLSLYREYTENQLYHFYEPELGLFIAETPVVIGRALDSGYEPVSLLTEERFLSGDDGNVIPRLPEDVPIYVADLPMMTEITGYNLTRGMLCIMRRRPQKSIEEICQGARRIAIMEDVVNPTNVGAIMRSAAALNMDAILLTSACADPLYRRAARVSMGTVFQIPWAVMPKNAWPDEAMRILRGLGYKTAAMALTDESISIEDDTLLGIDRLAVILGTEGEGLSDKTIEAADYTVKIPMTHGVDSLNVAAASAVAFWQLSH